MSANTDPNWAINSQTSDGTILSVTDGKDTFDAVTSGNDIYDIRDGNGDSIGTLDASE